MSKTEDKIKRGRPAIIINPQRLQYRRISPKAFEIYLKVPKAYRGLFISDVIASQAEKWGLAAVVNGKSSKSVKESKIQDLIRFNVNIQDYNKFDDSCDMPVPTVHGIAKKLIDALPLRYKNFFLSTAIEEKADSEGIEKLLEYFSPKVKIPVQAAITKIYKIKNDLIYGIFKVKKITNEFVITENDLKFKAPFQEINYPVGVESKEFEYKLNPPHPKGKRGPKPKKVQ